MLAEDRSTRKVGRMKLKARVRAAKVATRGLTPQPAFKEPQQTACKGPTASLR